MSPPAARRSGPHERRRGAPDKALASDDLLAVSLALQACGIFLHLLRPPPVLRVRLVNVVIAGEDVLPSRRRDRQDTVGLDGVGRRLIVCVHHLRNLLAEFLPSRGKLFPQGGIFALGDLAPPGRGLPQVFVVLLLRLDQLLGVLFAGVVHPGCDHYPGQASARRPANHQAHAGSLSKLAALRTQHLGGGEPPATKHPFPPAQT